MLGTGGYMSPEQVHGQETDQRADIFAFGVILYEVLSGKRTFGGGSAIEAMIAILKEEPPELSETNTKVSRQLEKIVRRCLEKQPERRFHSAHDLGFSLEALSTPSVSRPELQTGATAVQARSEQTRFSARVCCVRVLAAHNSADVRTAGSHSLAAAAHFRA